MNHDPHLGQGKRQSEREAHRWSKQQTLSELITFCGWCIIAAIGVTLAIIATL